ncbi:MAG: TnpV protein [Lachnospiraceae bacterium]|nr:TnpV protein [Lachnospiraceae bacterium]
MSKLKSRIHDEANDLDCILVGDGYISAIELPEGDDRPIGKWRRMYRAYLEETSLLLLNCLTSTGKLYTYLANLSEQVQDYYRLIIKQMVSTEGVNEDLKRYLRWTWISTMNSIVSHAEEIIL